MRIGLIGVGRIGVFHASTLRGLPGVDSLIITDADTDRARQVAGEFGAQTAEPGESFPAGPAHRDFMGRFGDAYVAELAAFIDVAAGQAASPCTVEDAREAFYVAEACELSRHRQQPVLVAEVR